MFHRLFIYQAKSLCSNFLYQASLKTRILPRGPPLARLGIRPDAAAPCSIFRKKRVVVAGCPGGDLGRDGDQRGACPGEPRQRVSRCWRMNPLTPAN
jgi:hypothetical protein